MDAGASSWSKNPGLRRRRGRRAAIVSSPLPRRRRASRAPRCSRWALASLSRTTPPYVTPPDQPALTHGLASLSRTTPPYVTPPDQPALAHGRSAPPFGRRRNTSQPHASRRPAPSARPSRARAVWALRRSAINSRRRERNVRSVRSRTARRCTCCPRTPSATCLSRRCRALTRGCARQTSPPPYGRSAHPSPRRKQPAVPINI